MKKSIAILIFSFLLINSGLFINTYYSELNLIKERAKEKISLLIPGTCDGKTILLKISKKELSDRTMYVEINDDEFFYKGNLYDVISKQDSNDTLTVYCLRDLDEEDFHKSISGFFDTHKDYDGIFQTEKTVQTANLNFILPLHSDLYPVQDESRVVIINFTNVLNGYFVVSDPPPKLIS